MWLLSRMSLLMSCEGVGDMDRVQQIQCQPDGECIQPDGIRS